MSNLRKHKSYHLSTFWRLPTLQLTSRSHLEDFESSDVEDSNERHALSFVPVETLVDSGDDPLEQLLVRGLGTGLQSVDHLGLVLGLGHHLATDLQLRSQQGIGEVL